MASLLEQRLYGDPDEVSIGALVLRGSPLVPEQSRLDPAEVVAAVRRKRAAAAPVLSRLATGGLVPGLGVQERREQRFSHYGELTMAVVEELAAVPLESFRSSLDEVYAATEQVLRPVLARQGLSESVLRAVIERQRAAFNYEQRVSDVEATYALLQELRQLGQGVLPARYEEELVEMLVQYNKKRIAVVLAAPRRTRAELEPMLIEQKLKRGPSIIQKLAGRLAKRALDLGLEEYVLGAVAQLREGVAPRLPEELFGVTVDDVFGVRFTYQHWEALAEAKALLDAAHASGALLRAEELGAAAVEDRIHFENVGAPHTAFHSTHHVPVRGRPSPDHVEVQLMPVYAKLFDHLHKDANRFLLDEARHQRRHPVEKQLYLSLLSHFEDCYRAWLPRDEPFRDSS